MPIPVHDVVLICAIVPVVTQCRKENLTHGWITRMGADSPMDAHTDRNVEEDMGLCVAEMIETLMAATQGNKPRTFVVDNPTILFISARCAFRICGNISSKQRTQISCEAAISAPHELTVYTVFSRSESTQGTETGRTRRREAKNQSVWTQHRVNREYAKYTDSLTVFFMEHCSRQITFSAEIQQ